MAWYDSDITDAFDAEGLAATEPKPTLSIVSGVGFRAELSRFFHREVSHL